MLFYWLDCLFYVHYRVLMLLFLLLIWVNYLPFSGMIDYSFLNPRF